MQKTTSLCLLEKIGCGNYGNVYRARDKSGNCCAVKLLPASGYADLVIKLWEGKILEQLDFAHIVKLQDMFFLPKDKDGSFFVYLVMECLDECLADFIDCRSGRHPPGHGLDERLVRSFLVQMARMLKYIHSQKVRDYSVDGAPSGTLIHRDFKPENILVSHSHPFTPPGAAKTPLLKLADFGISRVVQAQARTQVGTIRYMAPEIVLHQPYDQQADLFSLGAVLYTLCTFSSVNFTYEVLNCRGTFDPHNLSPRLSCMRSGTAHTSPHYSPELCELIWKLLDTDPSRRPTAREILHFDWLQADVRSAPFPSSAPRLSIDDQSPLEAAADLNEAVSSYVDYWATVDAPPVSSSCGGPW